MLSKSFNLKLNHKISPFNKIIKVDPDKSISIRSFLLGSISQNIQYCSDINYITVIQTGLADQSETGPDQLEIKQKPIIN